MKLGINWGCYGDIAPREQARLISKNGFETTFLSFEKSPRLEEIMCELKKESVACESMHAPFYGINRIWSKGEDGEQMLKELIDCVDDCARHEIPTIVVHLSSGVNAPRINEAGYERFARLMEHAKRRGVIVAYENQRMLANLAFVFEQFPEAGFCWDVGHEACFAKGMEYMPMFGKRLCVLHIHDNMMEYNSDQHMIPYDGAIDFDRVARHIAQSSYEGSVMLEVIRPNSSFYDDLSPEEYYRKASAAAARLEAQISVLRSEG